MIITFPYFSRDILNEYPEPRTWEGVHSTVFFLLVVSPPFKRIIINHLLQKMMMKTENSGLLLLCIIVIDISKEYNCFYTSYFNHDAASTNFHNSIC